MRPSESETEVEPTFFHMCATAQHYYRNEYVFTFFIGHCLAKKKNNSKIFFRGSLGKGEVQKQILWQWSINVWDICGDEEIEVFHANKQGKTNLPAKPAVYVNKYYSNKHAKLKVTGQR